MKRYLKLEVGATLVAVALTVLVGGSLSGALPLSAVAKANCTTDQSTTANDKHVIAVLSDGAADPSTKIARKRAMDTVLKAGFDDHARLLVDGIEPTGGGIPINIRLEATGNNQLLQEHDRTCKSQLINAALTKLMSARSAERSVFNGLTSLARHVNGLTASNIDVVLLSSLLNTTPELDLTDPGVVAEGVADLLAKAESAGLLPNCSGWRVYAVGPGAKTAGVSMTQAQVVTVRDFWSQFFHKCGGTLVSYDTELVTYPVTKTRPVVKRTAGSVELTLPGDVLFATDSSELSPEGAAVLADVVTTIEQSHPRSIRIDGHTDNTGGGSPRGDDHNQALSLTRAQSVAAWLSAHGVLSTLMTSRGWGATMPIASNDDSSGRQKNRRVEVSLDTQQ